MEHVITVQMTPLIGPGQWSRESMFCQKMFHIGHLISLSNLSLSSSDVLSYFRLATWAESELIAYRTFQNGLNLPKQHALGRARGLKIFEFEIKMLAIPQTLCPSHSLVISRCWFVLSEHIILYASILVWSCDSITPVLAVFGSQRVPSFPGAAASMVRWGKPRFRHNGVSL
jgi:hypothetical protein